MNKTDIKKIDQAGHVVGIHSHSHPTTLKKLSENFNIGNIRILKLYWRACYEKSLEYVSPMWEL